VPEKLLTANEAEVDRVLAICNACRYCEGFCAVFPAMTRRLEFAKADINYLANLCHNCGACLHACQYAPPHEFAVNVPQSMAAVRGQTYADYAWPAAFGALYRRNGLTLALATAVVAKRAMAARAMILVMRFMMVRSYFLVVITNRCREPRCPRRLVTGRHTGGRMTEAPSRWTPAGSPRGTFRFRVASTRYAPLRRPTRTRLGQPTAPRRRRPTSPTDPTPHAAARPRASRL